MTADFFEHAEEQSQVKAAIVADYFARWSTVMASRSPTVRYIDLFAGQGRYADGAESTPLRVIREALARENLHSRFECLLNDINPLHVARLDKEIKDLPGIDQLATAPDVRRGSVDDVMASRLAGRRLESTLTFLDPWGYKGLSLNLIRAVIKDWGSEAIFFFNYSRINAAIRNPKVPQHMVNLFGTTRLERLRTDVSDAGRQDRELAVRAALEDAVREQGAKFLLMFRIRRPKGQTHFLCFVSKNVLGYRLMKEVMGEHSDKDPDGVPYFEFPVRKSVQLALAPRRYAGLGTDLLQRFHGQALTVKEIIDTHTVGSPFLVRHYKDALMALESEGKVAVDAPKSGRRPPNTMGDERRVTFPRRTPSHA